MKGKGNNVAGVGSEARKQGGGKVSRKAHNLEVAGSSPAPASSLTAELRLKLIKENQWVKQ